MSATHKKSCQSVYKNTCNDLQKFLLSKTKNQKMCPTQYEIHQSLKKQNDFSVDYLDQNASKMASIRMKHNYTSGGRLTHLDISMDKQYLNKNSGHEPIKHKKLKANKSLLNLLLNHFHQEHKKNETFLDSESNSSYNIAPNTTNVFRPQNHTKNVRKQTFLQQRPKEMCRQPQFASFQIKNKPKISMKHLINEQKTNFQWFPQMSVNDFSKQQDSKRKKQNICSKNMANASLQSNNIKLSSQKSQKKNQETLIKIRNLYKQNRPCRQSQKYYKVNLKHIENSAQQACSIINPWSTTILNGQLEEHIMI